MMLVEATLLSVLLCDPEVGPHPAIPHTGSVAMFDQAWANELWWLSWWALNADGRGCSPAGRFDGVTSFAPAPEAEPADPVPVWVFAMRLFDRVLLFRSSEVCDEYIQDPAAFFRLHPAKEETESRCRDMGDNPVSGRR